jgi:hypothetical protein
MPIGIPTIEAGAEQPCDSAWTLKVEHYTVSKIAAVIPPLDDDGH